MMFAHYGLPGFLSGFHPAAREFPEPAPGPAVATFLHEDAPLMPQHARHHIQQHRIGLAAGHGALVHDAQMAGQAEVGQRAGFATGLAPADERAKFHHGLVVRPGLCGRQQLLRQGGDAGGGLFFLDRRIHVEDPGDDPFHIGVHAGHGLLEGDAGDGGRGVRPHAGQGGDILPLPGEAPAVHVADAAGRRQQVAGPGIVAQPLPGMEDLLLRGGRQGFRRGEALHPALEIADAPIHLRLLEHDLRDPDLVGRVGPAPGQVASVGGEPAQQGFPHLRQMLQGGKVARRRHGAGDGQGHLRSFFAHGPSLHPGRRIVIRRRLAYTSRTRRPSAPRAHPS